MNIDILNDTLAAKLEQELSRYEEDLVKNYKPKQIIEKSYETTFKQEAVSILECNILDKKEIQSLLKEDNALESLYKKYMKSDKGMLDNLQEILKDIAMEMAETFNKNKEKVR